MRWLVPITRVCLGSGGGKPPCLFGPPPCAEPNAPHIIKGSTEQVATNYKQKGPGHHAPIRFTPVTKTYALTGLSKTRCLTTSNF